MHFENPHGCRRVGLVSRRRSNATVAPRVSHQSGCLCQSMPARTTEAMTYQLAPASGDPCACCAPPHSFVDPDSKWLSGRACSAKISRLHVSCNTFSSSHV